MNYLAHSYLSGISTELLVGNFMGDFVKGRDLSRFPKTIEQGIRLHRTIDWYTDNHSLVRKTANRFRLDYGKYSGIVTDVIYDYFLADLWNEYSQMPLNDYITDLYGRMSDWYSIFPDGAKRAFQFFIKQGRLNDYASIDGISHSLDMMSRRTSLPDCTEQAISILKNESSEIKDEFRLFFTELRNYLILNYDVQFMPIVSY